MLETDLSLATVGGWALALAIVGGIAFIIRTKNYNKGVGFAAIGLVAYGLFWFLDQDKVYNIALIKGNGSDTRPSFVNDVVGGSYTFQNGQALELKRGENDSGTFIINDSDHYAMLVTVYFGVHFEETDKVIEILKPGETRYVMHYVNFIGAWDNPKAVPKTVEVEKGRSGTTRYLVTWADFEPQLGSIYAQEQPPAF